MVGISIETRLERTSWRGSLDAVAFIDLSFILFWSRKVDELFWYAFTLFCSHWNSVVCHIAPECCCYGCCCWSSGRGLSLRSFVAWCRAGMKRAGSRSDSHIRFLLSPGPLCGYAKQSVRCLMVCFCYILFTSFSRWSELSAVFLVPSSYQVIFL